MTRIYRTPSQLASFLTLLALVFVSPVANGDLVTWEFVDATLGSGATATGTIDFDDDLIGTDKVVAWDINVSASDGVPDFTLSDSLAGHSVFALGQGGGVWGGTAISFASHPNIAAGNAQTNEMRWDMQTTSILTNAGGTADLYTGTSNQNIYYNPFTPRRTTGGSLVATAAVPEPGSLALLATTATYFLLRRRR